ncbi:hypothetical protein EJB05_44147 [Eragrostis curvula]|uniref:Uncharacterized protein n=1 Tax=Eragrostis curvula TaxID=38414 RepID=A0A5J9TH47_9POAL|nr:hypothetical protein EJB05_44147 [Eragrostis curvula]
MSHVAHIRRRFVSASSSTSATTGQVLCFASAPLLSSPSLIKSRNHLGGKKKERKGKEGTFPKKPPATPLLRRRPVVAAAHRRLIQPRNQRFP